MRARGRGRTIGAVAASAAVHAVVLAALALYVPRLVAPEEDVAPPLAVIPVLLTPRTPPSPAGGKPAPIHLHRRAQRFAPPIPPLPVPPEEPKSTPKLGAVEAHPAPLPEGPKAEIRKTLRESSVGCANAEAVHLTEAERALCNEQLGKGARTAPWLGLGLPAAEQKALDAIAARKEADRRYRDQPALPGTDRMHGSPEPWRQPPDPHAPTDLPLLPP